MAVDVTVPDSDGWWMNYLWQRLRAKQPRLDRLENYRCGRPPLIAGSEAVASLTYRFQQQARSNFADLIVQALVERARIRSVLTAAGSDDDGDVQVMRLFQANRGRLLTAEVHRMKATFGEAYTSVAQAEAPDGWARIVAEDPRQFVTAEDPDNPNVVVAALKLFHDPVAAVDYVILWRPGRKVVAFRRRQARAAQPGPDGRPQPIKVSFSASTFTVIPEDDSPLPADDQYAVSDDASVDEFAGLLRSESYNEQVVPAVRHATQLGQGVFEAHTDLLDRINHMILQRIVIATLQAFKQRAIELTEDLPKFDPDTGELIDYNAVFSADPGALWKLPVGAKIWESGQVDLTGILAATKDDVLHLAAVTRTPFSMFSSDATNQSAEGAQLTREGLVFKVEDFQDEESEAWVDTMSIAIRFMPDDFRFVDRDGTRIDRADPLGMTIDWYPAERYSLAEKAQADTQAVSLPRRQKLRLIWGLTPAEVDTAMQQAAEDAIVFPPTPVPSVAPVRTAGVGADAAAVSG